MNEQNQIDIVMQTAKKLFFVGIGGISMSSLAFVCRRRGYTVAGSDRAYSAMTDKLENAGIPVVHTHLAENIEGADAVVYTGAVSLESPELAAAKAKKIPIIYRADLLGYIMKHYIHRIGVAGMHGKSTCTSMLAHLFMDEGKKPTVLSGAETEEMGGAYIIGNKDYFIFEACEYKDSFLCFFPTVSVVLGIDLDHTDYFTEGLPQIKRSFTRYANIPFESDSAIPFSVMCADDANVREIIPSVQDAVTFGIHENADYRAVALSENRGRFSFDILKNGNFDMFLCAFQMDVVPDFGFMLTPGNTHNFIRYNSTPMKDLINDLREREDQAGFAYASQAIQQQFTEDVPFISLFYRAGAILTRKMFTTVRSIREFELLRGIVAFGR